MYCERCRKVMAEEVCPECGKKCRDAREDDWCELLSTGQIWADMTCDLLKQENIPCAREGTLGAALAVLTGLSAETYHIYVPYAYLDQAKELTDALFSAPEAQEEAPDDPEAERETEEDE